MTTKILRKSTLALILALLVVGAGKSFAQSVPVPTTSQPTPDNPGGGSPNPTCTPDFPC